MADTPQAPLLDRSALESAFTNYEAPSIPDLPNVPFRGLNMHVPMVDGAPTPSALSALENAVLKGNNGKLLGGSVGRSLAESTSSRYDNYAPGDYNNEDAYAQGQGWPSKMVNAVGKGLLLTGTTLLQSTVGLVNGLVRWGVDGRAASFYDNGMNRWVDEVNKAAEDVLPNYYKDVEKNAAWYSPDKLFTANFFWDGIVKNMGFAAGAALSGGVYASALKALPLTARLFSVGKAAETLAATEEALIAADKVAETYGKVKSLSDKFLSSYKTLNAGGQALVAGLGTTGEAGFEAYNNLNQFRQDKIKEYKESHEGLDPIGEDLAAINREADNVGNSSFLLNTALLSATNYIQFPKILGSSYAAEKGMINSLTSDIEKVIRTETGEIIKEQATTRAGKFLSRLNKIRPYTFSTSEAFEEGAQYAIQVGTQDYYNKKYKGKSADFLGSLVEGVGQTLGTDEGMENVLIGGLSGSLMMARGRVKESIEKSKNTADAIQKFNKYNLSYFTRDTIDSVERGVAIQQEREGHLRQGDILESKDSEADYIINYLTPRIKYGRFDLVAADIADYRARAISNFSELQAEGKALPNDTQEGYLQRLDNLAATAENIKSLYQSLTLRYGNLVGKDGKPVYSPEVMDKMIYAATKVVDYDRRSAELTSTLALSGVMNTDSIIDDIVSGNSDSFNQAVEDIQKMKINSTKQEDLVQALTDVSEIALRRQMFLKEYDEIKKAPENFKEDEEVEIEKTKPTSAKDSITVKTKSGEKELEIGTEYFLGRVTKKDEKGNPVHGFPRLTILGENENGTIKIKDSEGKIHDLPRAELLKFKLGKVSDTLANKKAKWFMENVNSIFEMKRKGGKKPISGHLEYNPTDGILDFVYIDYKGEEQRMEVTREQFAARDGFAKPLIEKVGEYTLAQQKALEEFKQQEDPRSSAKVANRLSVLNDIYQKSKARLEEVNKQLEKNKKKITEADEALDNLSKTAKGLPRKSFTKAIRATIDSLSSTKSFLEKENTQLENEKDELETNLEYFSDFISNVEELPDNKGIIDELKQDIDALEELIDHTDDAIKNGKSLLESVDAALEQALSLFNDFVKRLKEENPNLPLFLEDFQQRLERYLGEEGAKSFIADKLGYTEAVMDLEDQIASFKDELKIPELTKKAQDLREQLKELSSGIDDLIDEQVAKSVVLQAFEDAAERYKQQKNEEEKIRKNAALKAEILGSADPGLQTRPYSKEYEPDAKKNELAIVLSTKLSSKSEAPHAKRTNFFGVLFSKMKPSERDMYKGVIVTSENEASFKLGGLTQHLKDQSELPDEKKAKIDANKTIALVIVRKDKDGIYKPVGQDGNILEDVSVNNTLYQVFPDPSLEWSEEYGGGTMFRKGTPADRIQYYKDEYQKWATETLENPSNNVHSIQESFGTPQYVTNSDGTPNYDAIVPVTDSGLIDEADLEDDNVIYIPTTDNTVSRGSTVYDSPLGRPFLALRNAFVNLKNRLFTKKEADTIYQAIRQLAIEIGKTGNLQSDNAKRYYNWLKSVVYWGEPRNAAGYNSIFFRDSPDGLLLHVSGKDKTYPFTPTAIRDNKSEIIDALQMMYNNVNSTMVKKDDAKYSWKQPYEEIISISENGEVEAKIWPNYQTYLLSSKGRKPEEVPLSTRIRPLRNVEGDVNRTGIYFTLSDSADSKRYGNPPTKVAVAPITPKIVPATAKPAPKAETKTEVKESAEGKIVLDGSTVNTYVSPKGKKVKFRASKAALKDPKALAIVKGGDLDAVLKDLTDQGKTLDEAKEAIRNAVKGYISPEIKKLNEEQELFVGDEEEEETPVITVEEEESLVIPEEEEAPFSTDVKADIEVISENYTPELLKANPNKLFLFGDNNTRTGKGGQAIIRDEPNAVGISTKLLPKNTPEAFMSDNQLADNKVVIDSDIKKAKEKAANEGKTIVLPKGGFGTGLAALATKAPQTFAYLNKRLQEEFGFNNVTGELAALEEAKPNVVEERLPAVVSVTPEEEALMQKQMDETEDDVVLRKVIEEQAKRFEREDWKKAEAWLKSKFPNIPVYRVKNILKGANGLQAWGMLKDGAIYVYENAEVGTIFHEVFEGVWKLFADPAEKVAILNEFRKRKGEFVDRPTGKTVKFSEATNSQIKEQLAEEFRDYILYKKIPAKPTQGKPFIVKLFSDLVNFIKTFFTGEKAQVNTANLFDKIGTGYYKQYVPESGPLAFAKKGLIDIEEAYITAGSELRVNMPADTVHDIMQEMTYQTFIGIIEKNESLFNIPKMKKGDLYKRLLEAMQKTVLKGRKEAQRNYDLKKIGKLEAEEQINKSVQLWKDITTNWDDLVKKHEEYLKVYSIEFDENDEFQFRDEDKIKESDYVDARKVDAFKKANSAIKLLFSTLPVMNANDKPAYSSINGYRLVPASQAFISIMNNVHTSRNPDEMLKRVREMAQNDPSYRTLYRRLTKVAYSANTDSLSNITDVHDGQLLSAFWRTFKKYNPDVKNVFIFEDGSVEVGDSNLATAARQLKSSYVNELIDLVKRKNPYFVYSQDKKAYIGNPAGVAKFKDFKPDGAITEIDKMVSFLETLGIDFKSEEITKLPGNIQDTFKEAVRGIRNSIEKTDMIATMGGKVLKIDGRLMSLATIRATIDNPEFDSTFFNVKGERTQTFIGTNPSSDLFDYLSQLEKLDDLVGTPYEYLLSDVFSNAYTDSEGNKIPTSVILSKIFNYKTGKRREKTENIMKTGYADGTIDRTTGKKKESSKLNFRERLIQEINLNLKGYYYNLVPGDASIQHMTFMGNHINPDELSTTVGLSRLNDIFKGYFISELELSRSDRKVAKGRNNKDLRFLKPIFDAYSTDLHADILKVSNKDKNKSAEEIYKSFEKKINAAVLQFVKKESDNTKKTLMDYNIITVSPEGYSIDNVAFQDVDNVTDEALNRQLNSLSINYIINNIELHKILYADPYQYSDELKRIKSFNSPRQSIVHGSQEMNSVFDRVWNKGYDKDDKDDIGYTDMDKESFTTTTLGDVYSTSNLKDYGIYNETDGSGIIGMKAYRNLRIRAADWNADEEKQYRYDIAWIKKDRGVAVSPEEQKLFDEGNPGVMSAYTPYKPIVSGNKANGQSFNDVVLDKFALYPLSYRIMKEINKSGNGIKLYEKMEKENIDYVVFESGRKVGAEAINEVYNEDGEFNDSPYEGIINVPFNIISVQSEVPSKEEAVVSRGSQVTKLVTLDYMEAGVPVDFMSDEKDFTKRYEAWGALADKTSYNGGDNLYKEIKDNQDLLKAITDFGYKTLLKKMGIQETIVNGKRRFEIKDFSKVAETLREEILKREVNDNVSDSLDGFLAGDVILEATPAYQQVRNILYSIADKNVISPKISGGQKVQIPSTLLESYRLKAEGKEGRVFSTDKEGLKFYEKDGERVCEIMIGRWFESDMSDDELLDYLNTTDEGQKILKGVAFRIPTQKQNSIDAFKIKKFLPKEFGDSVVIPSELVRKVGSDFDIDKLFIYLKNTYVDAKGQLKLIPYFGIGDSARSKYEEIFYDILQSKIDKAEAKKMSQSNLQSLFGDIALGQAKEKATAKWVPLFKKFFSEEVIDGKLNVRNVEDIFMMRLQKLGKKLDKLTDYDIQEILLDEFMDRMYKKSLENEYIESMQNLISHPLNFENLIKPNSAEELKELAGDITKKLGLEKLDSSSTASLISRNYMTRLRHAFVTGKYAIGIAAVNQTNHSLNQRAPIYIDLNRFDYLSETDKFWITGGTKDRKDAVLKFKDNEFNQIDVDGESVTTLSMIENKAGEYISDIIGMFIDGYVDISKGPWIMELGATPNVASTWLFLVKAGVPIETVAYFMNQPIIRDYLRMIENEGYSWLFIDDFVKDIKESDKYRTSRSINDVRTLPSATKMFETIGKEKLDQDERINQHFVLNEFLKYATMANQMFHVTQGSNFDTSTFNDPYLIFKKLRQYEKAQNTIISSVDKILENSFIGDLRDKLDGIRGAFAEVLKSDHPVVRDVVQKVLDNYIDLPDREFVKVAQKIVNDLFDWAVQVETGSNKQIKSILLSDKSAAKEVTDFVKKVKSDDKHPLFHNQVIDMLTPHFSARENSVQNVKLNNKTNKVYDQNQIIYSFEEIKKYLNGIDSSLYKKIVKLAVLQSGLSSSPISFTSLLPYKDFKEEYNKTLANLENMSNLEDFVNLNVFQRNNWNDDDIVPYRKGKMKFPKEIDADGNVRYTGAPYYSELRWGKGFGDVKKAITDGKIPQLIRLDSRSKQAGDDVIVFSWEVGTKKDKQDARARGDLSYIQKGLFKKVYAGGQPYMIEDYFGNPQFVYKMINAWGDSHQEEGRYFSANEFYDHARKSQINNGFIPVENEVDDTTIKAFFEGTASVYSNEKETAGNTMKLKDGVIYNYSAINTSMLEKMGYTPQEIGKILKSIC